MGRLFDYRVGVYVGDTGAPRGEPNCWYVLLEGVSVYQRLGGKSAENACVSVAEKLNECLKEYEVSGNKDAFEPFIRYMTVRKSYIQNIEFTGKLAVGLNLYGKRKLKEAHDALHT